MPPMRLVDPISLWLSPQHSSPSVSSTQCSFGSPPMLAKLLRSLFPISSRWFLPVFALPEHTLLPSSHLLPVASLSAKSWKPLSLHSQPSSEHSSTERRSPPTSGCALSQSLVVFALLPWSRYFTLHFEHSVSLFGDKEYDTSCFVITTSVAIIQTTYTFFPVQANPNMIVPPNV